MRNSCIVVFIALCWSCVAQIDSVKEKNKRVRFSVFAGPTINYRKSYSDFAGFGFTTVDPSYGYTYTQYVYYAKYEKPKIGYQLGFTVGFRLSENSIIKIGLTAQRLGYKTQLIDTVYGKFESNLWGSNTTSYSKSVNNLVLDYSFTYFSFPLLYSYSYTKSKYRSSPNIGLAFDALYSSERISTFTGEQENSNPKFPPDDLKVNYYWKDINRPFYLSLIAGFDVEYPFNERCSFSVEPQFKYVFYRLNKKTKSKNTDFSSPEEYLDRTMGRIRPSDLYALSILFKFNF